MKKFDYGSGLFTTTENSNIRLLNLDATMKLANLLGLEVVEYEGEGTVDIIGGTSNTINKSSIKAIKFEEDFLFFMCANGSYHYVVAVDSNLDYIANGPLFSNSSAPTVWYAFNENVILFRSNSMGTTTDYSVCVTRARDINGNYVPVIVYGRSSASNSTMSKSIRGKNISDEVSLNVTISNTYYTLLSLAKVTFANAQLICDYVYIPTHTGNDYSPKRILLNGETWVYSGSSSAYNAHGIYIKLDK